MKELVTKIRRLFKGENLKKIENSAVKSGVAAIETQIRTHDEAAEKNDEIIVSREITGLIVKSNSVRRDNYERILHDTAEKMNVASSSPEFAKKTESAFEVNPDFFLSFFDSMKNISDAKVREYWATILKGELESPGRMSVAVVDVLRKLDRETATLFDEVLQYQSNHWFFYDLDKQFPISLKKINNLIEHGLILPMTFGQSVEIPIGKDGRGHFNYCGLKILVERIEGIKGKGNLSLPLQKFTSVALSIAKAVDKKHLPDKTFLARIAKFIGSEEMVKTALDPSIAGRFRMWVSVQSGKNIPIDSEKPDGGVDFHFTDEGKIAVKPK